MMKWREEERRVICDLPACFWSSLLPSLFMGPTTFVTATLSPVCGKEGVWEGREGGCV
jgi:hypothetical protein